MPHYKYYDFNNACANNSGDVIPIGTVLKNAADDFNLKTKSQLLDFISNNGLEDLSFVNTKEWENNRDRTVPIMVDAYEFQTMHKLGYIAFMRNENTDKWIIKSFHLSDNRSLNMYHAIEKAGLISQENEDE